MKRIYLKILFIVLVIYLFGCGGTHSINEININKGNIYDGQIVPIKFPTLPYVLKFNKNSLSYNNTGENLLHGFDNEILKVATVETSKKKPLGHKVEGAEYYDELWDKFSVIAIDNGEESSAGDNNFSNYSNSGTYNDAGGTFGEAAGQGLGTGNSNANVYFDSNTVDNSEDYYGECEIVKFNNQIRRETRNRCFGYLYFQIKVTKKGKRYVQPRFKIKNADGLRMEFFSEKFPELYGVDENEIVEGYIYVSDQEYSDTYELTITQ